MAITATEARKRLFPLIRQVNEDRAPVEIISNHGRAYLVAADDYDEVRRGRTLITRTMEELEAMADEGEPR